MTRNYGLEIEEDCAACGWEARNGYVRDRRTGKMVLHDHDPRWTISLVWGRHRLKLWDSHRIAEPVTASLPKEFWKVEKYK